MTSTALKIILMVVFILFVMGNCLRMVPERASLDYVDSVYVEDALFNVRRYGRKSDYYVNLEGTLKHTWGDNISLHVTLFEFLHNEYKPTFVEFHFENICKMLKTDPFIGRALFNAGITKCPMPPNHYAVRNASIPSDNFPYVWPFEKAKGVGAFYVKKTLIAKGTLYMRFLQK